MNSIEFAQRVCLNLKTRDISALSGDDALAVVTAMNASIQQFFTLVPSIYRQTDISADLPAPVSVASIGVTSGSNLFSTFIAQASDRGKTIRVNGDVRDNEIVASNALLHNYSGSTGTTTAIVYGDAIAVTGIILRILDDPILETGDRLTHSDHFGGAVKDEWQRDVGKPRRYRVESVGQVRNADTPFLLRVDPLPDIAYRMKFRAELLPARLMPSCLSTPAQIPVNDQMVESILIPMCNAVLSAGDLWANERTRTMNFNLGESAKTMAKQLTPTVSTPVNRVGTPWGF